MQRKINFYLIHEDNQFKLRAVQVERDKLFSNNRGHIDRAARARLEAPFSMPNYIWSQFARFNMLNLRDWNTGEVFRTYGLADNSETVIDQFHQNAAFFLIDRTYELKLGEKNLLMFLGCLDSAIHSYQHDLKDDKVENDGTFIEYCDTLPDFSNRFQLCHDALNKRMPPAKKRRNTFVAPCRKLDGSRTRQDG